MERTQVVDFIGGKESWDELGALTKFRSISNQLVANVVEEGTWFTFCRAIDKSQIDILSIKNNTGTTLGKMIKDIYSENFYKVAVFKYLLHDYMCYCEVPIVKRSQDLNGFKNSFNKYIITSSLEVAAYWMGISLEEAELAYGGILNEDIELDSPDEEFPYLKLYTDKTGVRKVTKPRSYLDLSQKDLRIIPVFALKTGVDVLWSKVLNDDVYDISFVKDSGQVRDMTVSSNMDVVIDLYGKENEAFVKEGWSSCYNGEFLANKSLDRGYIRVFEIGSSIYNNPTRSINYARIVGIKEGNPDMSYMYIDTDMVLDNFVNRLYTIRDEEIPNLVEMLDLMEVGSERVVNGRQLTSKQLIENWASVQETLLSTVFLRQLALFMIANQQWFNGYTGARVEPTANAMADQLFGGAEDTSDGSDGDTQMGMGDMPFDLELSL